MLSRSRPPWLTLTVALTSCQPSQPAANAPSPCPTASATPHASPAGPTAPAKPNTATPTSKSQQSTSSGAPERGPNATEVAFSNAPRTIVDLNDHFVVESVSGAFVGYDAAQSKAIVHGPEIAATGYLPASTFKIPHAVIALETGVLASADEVIPWDGQRRWHPAWNLDLSLREAIQHSSWPHFATIAQRIGPERMTTWLARFEYGNQTPTGGEGLFWLIGDLRISPIEQIDFLQRLTTGKLPITDATRSVVRDLLFFGRRGAARVYAKTGSTDANGPKPVVNWFVGWVERRGGNYYFATLLLDPPEGKWAARMLVTDRILTSLGVLPAGARSTTAIADDEPYVADRNASADR